MLRKDKAAARVAAQAAVKEEVMVMGAGTKLVALFALFACILFADTMLDNPVAFTAAIGSLIILGIIVKEGGRHDE